MKMLRDKEQTIEEGIVIKERQIYIPEEELKGEVIWLHHNMPIGEHRGRQKTTKLVMRNYWWLGVTKEVGKYMDRYDACQH